MKAPALETGAPGRKNGGVFSRIGPSHTLVKPVRSQKVSSLAQPAEKVPRAINAPGPQHEEVASKFPASLRWPVIAFNHGAERPRK